MIIVIIALSLGLAFLGYRYHRLLLRCSLAEQKIRSQEELQAAYDQISKESFSLAQEKALEAEDEKRKILAEMLSKLEGQIRSLEAERKTDHGSLKHQLKSLLDAEHHLNQKHPSSHARSDLPQDAEGGARSSCGVSWSWPG